jgi:molecular chaperone DnaK (HSP70)
VSNLVARALADYKKAHPALDVAAALDRPALFKLWETFRGATERLFSAQSVRLEGGGEFDTDLTRTHFEDVNKALFQKCLDMVTRCLADARLETAQIADVLVLGGGAKIPKLEEMLAQMFTGGGGGRLGSGEGFQKDFLVRGVALEAAIAGGMEGVDKGLLLLQVGGVELFVSPPFGPLLL